MDGPGSGSARARKKSSIGLEAKMLGKNSAYFRKFRWKFSSIFFRSKNILALLSSLDFELSYVDWLKLILYKILAKNISKVHFIVF